MGRVVVGCVVAVGAVVMADGDWLSVSGVSSVTSPPLCVTSVLTGMETFLAPALWISRVLVATLTFL